MLERIKKDIQVVRERDPAARSSWEIFLCYPGLHALFWHRINHWLWNHNWKLLARWLSLMVRFFTAIEIHPGAQIGEGFFIDHGLGVVIGETTIVGKNVTIYQGVTLGGTSWRKEKRHPTIDDNVIIGASAVVLGPITIGHDSKIGACSVVVQNVPPHSTVVGVPGRIAAHPKNVVGEHYDLEHGELPDPEWNAITSLKDELHSVEQKITKLMKERPTDYEI